MGRSLREAFDWLGCPFMPNKYDSPSISAWICRTCQLEIWVQDSAKGLKAQFALRNDFQFVGQQLEKSMLRVARKRIFQCLDGLHDYLEIGAA